MDATSLLLKQNARVAAAAVQFRAALEHFEVIVGGHRQPFTDETRQKTRFPQRIDWDRFIEDYKDRPFFHCHMWMFYNSFCVLLGLVYDKINLTDDLMGSLRGGKIIPEIYLYSTIRYLAGVSYTDICCFCGISVTSFYVIVWKTMAAINRAIKIEFPSGVEECAVAAVGFEGVSYDGVIKNCVGAVDGYLLSIQTPGKTHAKNVRSFFSGHYQKNGINIQASCDVNCRFTFLGLGGPGVTQDRVGVEASGLSAKITFALMND